MTKMMLTSIASALLVGCTPLAPWFNDGQSRRAVIFGDSLTWDSHDELTDHDRGVTLSINSYPGTTASNWLDTLDSVPPGVNVVFALGTNDVVFETLDDAKYHAEIAINRLQENGNRVVWLTLNSYSAWLRSPWEIYPRVLEYNRWLRELADSGRYPAFTVLEWDHISYSQLDWLQTDQVHHTATGQARYANALAESAVW